MAWYNSQFGLLAGMGVFMVRIGAYMNLSTANHQENPIQQQVMGQEAEDTCLIRDGVTYCAEVDGMDLTDLVQQFYQRGGEE